MLFIEPKDPVFERKRAAHYNEWRALQAFRKSHSDDDDDEKMSDN